MAGTEQVLLNKQQRLLRVRGRMLGRRKHAVASSSASPVASLQGEDQEAQGAADNQDDMQQGSNGNHAAQGTAMSTGTGAPAVPAQSRKGAATSVEGQGGMVQLPRRLMEQLLPRSRAALLLRVQQELAARGGFIPLMHLFSKQTRPNNVGTSSDGSSPGTAGAPTSSPGAAPAPVLVLGRKRKTAVAVPALTPAEAAPGSQQAAGDVEMAAAESTGPGAVVDRQLLDALANASFPWSDLDLECQEMCASAISS
jgi:hypothetical protein